MGQAATREAERLRRPLPQDPEQAEMVRYATLAPSGHNMQPWRFVLAPGEATILPDHTRRTPIVDPDDHHLFVSLGCAAENFVLAAEARYGQAAAAFENKEGGRIDIAYARTGREENDLFRAIPNRQSTRAVYDGRALSKEELGLLERAARVEGVALRLITDPKGIEDLTGLVLAANEVQVLDAAFTQELTGVVRFNEKAALASRDGLWGACLDSPPLPQWAGKRIFPRLLRPRIEARKYAKQIRSSAGIAIFTGTRCDKDHWVRVGRSFQRFALQATALGIRHAHINQAVEVPASRAELAAWLGARGSRPDLAIRFGRGPSMPSSLRRTPEEVIARIR